MGGGPAYSAECARSFPVFIPAACEPGNGGDCCIDTAAACESVGYAGPPMPGGVGPCGSPSSFTYGSPAAPVPELEDYAAAVFLALAVWTGWFVRRRRGTI